MAARKGGARKNAAPKPRAQKGKTHDAKATAKSGHNKIDRQAVKLFFDRLDRAHESKESDNASHMADIRGIYDDAAIKLDVKAAAVRDVYREHRAEMKRQDREKEMDPEKVQERDSLRLALGSFADSPLGNAAKEREEREDAAKEMAGAPGED